MGDNVQSISKDKINNIHPASHLIAEGCQVDQTLFPLRKSMLIAPNTFLSFMVLGTVSRVICSISFPGIKVRLPCLAFSFLPFSKNDAGFLPACRNRP